MDREKVKGEKMYHDMRACFEYVYVQVAYPKFVCMFKVSWKKKKRTAYLEYDWKKKF